MSTHSIEESPLYGLMAEFETAGELVAAARRTKDAGFRKFDAYSPFPIHELDDAMDLHDNRVSLFTLIGGLIGSCTGFGLASWVQGVALPLNIGGRPLISAPMYIPITFELEHVLADGLGLGGLRGHAGLLHDVHFPVHPRAADDHDFRAAHAPAGSAG